jgi:hypothetical protein
MSGALHRVCISFVDSKFKTDDGLSQTPRFALGHSQYRHAVSGWVQRMFHRTSTN